MTLTRQRDREALGIIDDSLTESDIALGENVSYMTGTWAASKRTESRQDGRTGYTVINAVSKYGDRVRIILHTTGNVTVTRYTRRTAIVVVDSDGANGRESSKEV